MKGDSMSIIQLYLLLITDYTSPGMKGILVVTHRMRTLLLV